MASVTGRYAVRQPVAAKVPAIGALFWLIKVLTTGVGEASSDYLAGINLLLAGAVGIIGFAAAMWWQFHVRRYQAFTYWFAVLMVAVFGTMVADGLHVGLGVPYPVSSAIYAVLLAVVFWLWRRSEKTLSIHSIVTRRRETYYWLTVLMSFALGTALGDLTAIVLHLGYLGSTVLFAALIAVPAVGWWRFKLNPTVAFWIAYVITRPLGASLADWIGKPRSISGLGLGDGTVCGITLLAIAALVGYLHVRRPDVQTEHTVAAVRPEEMA